MEGKMTTTSRLLQYLPDRDDLANALGLRPSASASLLAGLGFFGAGMLIGSALALLLTPRTGPELRRDLKQRMDGVMDRIQRGRIDGEDHESAQA
jgi:YtxH-like protein